MISENSDYHNSDYFQETTVEDVIIKTLGETIREQNYHIGQDHQTISELRRRFNRDAKLAVEAIKKEREIHEEKVAQVRLQHKKEMENMSEIYAADIAVLQNKIKNQE